MAVLRVGYNGSNEAGSGVTAGAGFRLFGGGDQPSSASPTLALDSFELDYAFVDMGALGNANRIGVLIRFGPEVKPEAR
jgi:hypothetical protein